MAMDDQALGKMFDKAIKALAGHHLNQTRDRTVGAGLLDDCLVRAMAAVPQLAVAIHPATILPSVGEAGLSALLLRVLQTTAVEAGFHVVKRAPNGHATHATCACATASSTGCAAHATPDLGVKS